MTESSLTINSAVTLKELDALMNVIHNDGGLTTLTGTVSADLFVIDREFGQRTIVNFNKDADKVDMSAYQDDQGNLTLDITQKGDDVIVNLTPFENGNLILKGVVVGDLTADHFAVDGATTLNVVDAGDVRWDIISNDFEEGESGNDTLDPFGDEDNDLLHGGAGDDHIYGWKGDDIIFGGAGNDLLEGEHGYDIIYGGAGDDDIFGVSRFGVLDYPESGNELYGGAGNDYIDAGLGVNIVNGGSGNNRLFVYEGAAHIIYDMDQQGVDTIRSFSSDDKIEIRGLDGTDLSVVKDGDHTVINMVDNGGTAGSIKLYDVSPTSLSASQFVGVDTISMDGTVLPSPPPPPTQDLTLEGTDGDDNLSGGIGNDTITGGKGNDNIWGYGGNDMLHGGAGDDFIHGNDGADTIYAGDGDDHVKGGEEATGDTIYGEAGNDRLNGGGGNDTLYGGEGNDDLKGYEDNDTLYGGAGDDIVGGSTGTAGKGNDAMYGDAGDDTVDGGVGSDTVSGGSGTNTVTGGSGADTFVYVMSEEGVDTFTDFSAEDTLDIQGLVGTELVLAEVGNDVVIDMTDNGGTAGSITLQNVNISELSPSQFTGVDTLAVEPHTIVLGDSTANTLSGGEGSDKLKGFGGDDTLNGGNGDDTLHGGRGSDTFVFGTGSGDDTILDFGDSDTVDLSAFDTTWAQVQAALSTDGDGNATLTLDADTSVTFEGVLTTELVEADFLF